MHAEAMNWLKRIAPLLGLRRCIADFGALNVNGSAREVFHPDDRIYVGVDVRQGEGVDVIADAAWWSGPDQPPDLIGRDYKEPFDLIISTECLEHTPYAVAICHNAYRLLRPGGVFLITAAGPKRQPHSVDGGSLGDGEWYRNISEGELREWLRPFAVKMIQNRDDIDLYALAVKGE